MLKPQCNKINCISLIIIICTLLGAWLTFDHFAAVLERKSQINLSAIALSKKSQIEIFLHERQSDAAILSKNPATWQTLAARSQGLIANETSQQLADTIANMARLYGFSDVQLFDTALEPVMTFRGKVMRAIEIKAFNRAIKTRKTVIVDMHIHDGELCFGIASPVFEQGEDDRVVIGVVYLEITTRRHLDGLIAEWPQETRSAETLLLKIQGDEVVYLSPLKFAPQVKPMGMKQTLNARELTYANKRTFTGRLISGKDYRNVEVIGATQRINNTEWVMFAKVDKAEIQQPVIMLRNLILLGTSITILLMLLTTRLLWRVMHANQIAREATLDGRYSAARRASIDAYVVLDKNLHFIDVNEAVEKLSGFSRDELLNMSLSDISIGLSPDELSDITIHLSEVGGVRFVTRCPRKDGSFYDAEVSASFIADPAGDTFHAFFHDITAELAAQRRLARLNTFNVFMNHTNAAIFNLSTPEAILQAVCKGAIDDGGFVLCWAGMLDGEAATIEAIAAFGSAAGYMQKMAMTDESLLYNRNNLAYQCMAEKKLMFSNDFQADPATAPWHELAAEYGIQSVAAVPVIVYGKAVAALNFYGSGKNFFDEEYLALLEEAARNISLALQAVSADQDKEKAEAARQASEERFQRAFDASPIPMNIGSLSSKKLKYMNKAHERIFGYLPDEVPDQDVWFNLVFPDPEIHKHVTDMWYNHALPGAIKGGPGFVSTSPEISLCCKDGSHRIGHAMMTVVGDDVIVQWQDLTDIRRAESSIIANEQRFRGMIEQTLTGIYVSQNGKIVYANPRFSEISGWSNEELLGHDSLDFYSNESESRQKIIAARQKLLDGQRSVAMEVDLACKDGKTITLDTYASMNSWDGKPAVVVMAIDITEKKCTEEKIAVYARQLESAMEGTLYAVANMVEQRDPYTSGHELRVGIIASDIARAMGWPDEKCKLLRLIGLVHDIGKISIPAEILSKPGRLSPLEYEIVKTHAQKGYEILKDVESPWPIANIIRQHHERLDGSGYPQGLKGLEILPEARILAVADVLESMSSHRPYRASLGLDAAIDEIQKHRESWFDPLVVDTLVNMVREQGYVLPT